VIDGIVVVLLPMDPRLLIDSRFMLGVKLGRLIVMGHSTSDIPSDTVNDGRFCSLLSVVVSSFFKYGSYLYILRKQRHLIIFGRKDFS